MEAEQEIKDNALHWRYLKQGYLLKGEQSNLRIRHENNPKAVIFQKDYHHICFKQKINDRVIEIENEISKIDFDELWSFTNIKLEKIRYTLVQNDEIWVVDAFQYDGTYFLMAEFEMPDGQKEPEFIPEIIFKNLLFPVPREDGRFSSMKLADVEHAKKTYLQLKELK